jgi:hypothetical protein
LTRTLTRREHLKVVADVGSTRVVGTVIKENVLTTVIKIEPESLIKVLHNWFMENGISITEFYRDMKSMGIKRNGTTKRHNLKHRVTYAGE